MKKITLFICALCSLSVYAQNSLYIHQSDNIINHALNDIDSLIFNDDATEYTFFKNGVPTFSKSTAQTDSITFQYGSVLIMFNGTTASVINPFAGKGVEVAIVNADVTVTSTLLEEIDYIVTGTTTDGCVKIYSNHRFFLTLKNAHITNNDGAAINIQSGKKTTLRWFGDNTLADGATYAATTEDMKATLFSEGQIVFEGTGTLSVSSLAKHAICSDDYIAFNNGTITITSAGKDGVHANDYVTINGGILNISATSDGIDCGTGFFEMNAGQVIITSTTDDVKAVKCDSILTINGGVLNMTVSGAQSKGLSSKHNMFFNGGTIIANMSGNIVITNGDPSYCTAIKCDRNITIQNIDLTISSNSPGGRGISCDSNLFIYGGKIDITMTGDGSTYTNTANITDAYSAAAIKCDGDIAIISGNIQTKCSGSAGKGLVANGGIALGTTTTYPNINITTTGGNFVVSNSSRAPSEGAPTRPPGGNSADYCLPKAIKADGAITVDNGNIVITSTDDGYKSETSFTMNGGDLTIVNSVEGIEGPLITINGGVLKITSSDDAINATKGDVSGGAERDDGSWFYMKGGIVIANSTKADVIDSNGRAQMTGGVLIANCQASKPEEVFDCNGGFTLVSGVIATSGKTTTSLSSPNQSYLSISSSSISSSTYVQVKAANTEQVVFKPKYNSLTRFFVSGKDMKKGATYQIYTGGTYSGGEAIDGCYFTGGTYSGGTLKNSGTLSTSSVSNSITF